MDDMLIAFKNKIGINKLNLKLKEEFEMKHLGKARMILETEIQRGRKFEL